MIKIKEVGHILNKRQRKKYNSSHIDLVLTCKNNNKPVDIFIFNILEKFEEEGFLFAGFDTTTNDYLVMEGHTFLANSHTGNIRIPFNTLAGSVAKFEKDSKSTSK